MPPWFINPNKQQSKMRNFPYLALFLYEGVVLLCLLPVVVKQSVGIKLTFQNEEIISLGKH